MTAPVAASDVKTVEVSSAHHQSVDWLYTLSSFVCSRVLYVLLQH